MKYYLPDRGETKEDAVELKADWLNSAEDAAKAAADEFHSFRNGYEAEWPVEIVVIGNDGSEHCFEVEREIRPEFVATRKRRTK